MNKESEAVNQNTNYDIEFWSWLNLQLKMGCQIFPFLSWLNLELKMGYRIFPSICKTRELHSGWPSNWKENLGPGSAGTFKWSWEPCLKSPKYFFPIYTHAFWNTTNLSWPPSTFKGSEFTQHLSQVHTIVRTLWACINCCNLSLLIPNHQAKNIWHIQEIWMLQMKYFCQVLDVKG